MKRKLEPPKQLIVIRKVHLFFARYINYKMGALSGLITGSLVFAINVNHGFLAALAGFAKQFAFNLLMAGYNTRTCERVVRAIENMPVALLLGTIIPTFQAFIVLYSVHYFGGTPKPMASTLWQGIANVAIFYSMAYVYKRKQLNPLSEKALRKNKKWWQLKLNRPLLRKAG